MGTRDGGARRSIPEDDWDDFATGDFESGEDDDV
jgi:hypothetical protein